MKLFFMANVWSAEEKEKVMDKYICEACMYVYDPAENDNIPFEELPDDYVCPVCGVSKAMFTKQ